MAHQIDFVIFRSPDGADVAEGAASLRDLRTLWPESARVLVGLNDAEALARMPDQPEARCLFIESVWLTPEARCLQRLHGALDAGFDVAIACDSSHPGPMADASYATRRGMERFVDAQTQYCLEVPPDTVGSVELVTSRGLQRRRAGDARVARVAGAWAHDASAYFSSARDEVLPLVPGSAQHVLDVGGGRGGFLAGLKATRPLVQTHLIELTQAAASHARNGLGVDHVWVGDFLAFCQPQRFDCISFLDVLEHFEDPDRALTQARRLLSEEGTVIASIPNVGHWSVVADLLEGRWDWAVAGIHCYTHLRFFTKQTVGDMFSRCGFQIEVCTPVTVACDEDWLSRWASPRLNLNRESLETYAYLLRARPVEASRAAS